MSEPVFDAALAPEPDHKRADMLIHAFAAVSAFALVGMLVDVWQMVFLTVPLFAVVLMLKGSLRSDGTWERQSTIGIVGYCAVLAGLVAWSILSYNSDTTLWGIPMSMAVIVYFIWPYTAVVAGLLYAFVFDRTIDEKRLADVTD
ncbi:hypothetical protein K3888_01410 [Dietzia aurantiaca]|uniref:hypothetical protein n=1 Tax=Dietzia aurantiaca TaxID=983873 RepID=UPI001E5475BF|nr:hypothetical protein [Dietzia aurantiaca]MCD2261352.1 hypothetical protein [Dietzia aurantiaca]